MNKLQKTRQKDRNIVRLNDKRQKSGEKKYNNKRQKSRRIGLILIILFLIIQHVILPFNLAPI